MKFVSFVDNYELENIVTVNVKNICGIESYYNEDKCEEGIVFTMTSGKSIKVTSDTNPAKTGGRENSLFERFIDEVGSGEKVGRVIVTL